MGMISGLFKSLRRQGTARRTWTPAEVRELIDLERLDEARAALDQLSPNVRHLAAEKACLTGEIQFRERQDERAAASFRQALAEFPGMADAHYGLSLILAEQGLLEDAVLHAQFAVQMNTVAPRYLAQAGYCHLRLDNFQAAETPLRRATRLMANNPYLWNNLGIVLRAKGDAVEARQCFLHALRFKPDFATAQGHLNQLDQEIASGQLVPVISLDPNHALRVDGGAATDSVFAEVLRAETAGELQRAIEACEALELTRPDDERVPVTLSRLYERVGEADSARDALAAYLNRHPGAAGAQGALGLVLLRMHHFVAAERLLVESLGQSPAQLDLLLGLAGALSGQERFAEAGEQLEKARALDPDSLAITGQLAANLANRCRYVEALTLIEAMNSQGHSVACKAPVLGFLGRFDEALSAMNVDIERHPRDPATRLQRGTINLLLGNYAQGWEDYSYRGHGMNKHFRMLPFPMWRGESLAGKQIIVLAEQGLGDQIMFFSCLGDLQALGPARVVLEAHQRVAKTLARSGDGVDVIATSQGTNLDWARDYPNTDFFVHLGDLPRFFRRELADFPQHTGFLRADPERVGHWARRLRDSGEGPYIGMSWKGGTELTRSPLRSMTPERFMPMARQRTATWVCLQYGDVKADVERAAAAGFPMCHWPEAIEDLDEFAALISALDLVVTVCNTTVHYAGALGRPVWILAPRVPEWRYGLTTERMPWYPSSLMFRQREDQNWQDPIDAVCQKLSDWSPNTPARAQRRPQD